MERVGPAVWTAFVGAAAMHAAMEAWAAPDHRAGAGAAAWVWLALGAGWLLGERGPDVVRGRWHALVGALIVGVTEFDPTWGFTAGVTWVFKGFTVNP